MKKNQGFSLVELIVVIAIMAVLVGVLAPAYLRYVEKSRKSTDVSSVSDILAAAEKVAIDPQFDLAAGATFLLSGGATLSMSETDVTDAASDAEAEWKAIAGDAYTFKSKEFKAEDHSFSGELKANGSVVWTISSPLTTFSPDFASKWGASSGS